MAAHLEMGCICFGFKRRDCCIKMRSSYASIELFTSSTGEPDCLMLAHFDTKISVC